MNDHDMKIINSIVEYLITLSENQNVILQEICHLLPPDSDLFETRRNEVLSLIQGSQEKLQGFRTSLKS